MNGGAKYLLATVALTSGCASQPALKLRALPDPLAAARKPGNPVLGEARAMLALGNVGTAIEGFRQAQREQPDSTEPLAGLAECYDRMGRFDVSRQYYEAALAITPRNPVLLNAFATSLAREGRTAESVAVRAEAMAATQVYVPRPAPRLAAATVTVPLPPAKPAPWIVAVKPVSQPVAPIAAAAPIKAAPAPVAPPPAIPAPVLNAVMRLQAAPAAPVAPRPVNIASTVPAVLPAEPDAPAAAPAPVARVVEIPAPMVSAAQPLNTAPAAPVAPRPVNVASVAAAVVPSEPQVAPTPAVAPARAAPAARTVIVPAATSAGPIARAPIPPAQVRVANAPPIAPAAPHLERMSQGEVALVSAPATVWSSASLAPAHQSLAVRFVPLNMAMERPAIQLLNAARSDRLAANARSTLVSRGWRELAIGDARHVRDRSLVLYPAEQQSLGRRLARQFGIASAVSNRSTRVVVLLGRDMAAIRASRQRG